MLIWLLHGFTDQSEEIERNLEKTAACETSEPSACPHQRTQRHEVCFEVTRQHAFIGRQWQIRHCVI
jgi:hypothetical protein